MEISSAGLELITRSEGFRAHVYLDVAGLPTIGFGHRLLPHESFPEGISEADALRILSADLRLAEQAVLRLVKVPLTQGQFDALTDFCFNLGPGRLASSTLLKALNARGYEAACEQLLRWNLAGGEINQGLRARREAEALLWTQPATRTQSTSELQLETTARHPTCVGNTTEIIAKVRPNEA